MRKYTHTHTPAERGFTRAGFGGLRVNIRERRRPAESQSHDEVSRVLKVVSDDLRDLPGL